MGLGFRVLSGSTLVPVTVRIMKDTRSVTVRVILRVTIIIRVL